MQRPGQWLHGFLDLCLLSLLAGGDDYGYGLAHRLTQAGFGDVAGGTLYPALLRLEQQGMVSTSWHPSESGPRRKYYALTREGSAALETHTAGWRQFRDSVESVVTEQTRRTT